MFEGFQHGGLRNILDELARIVTLFTLCKGYHTENV